MGKTKIKPVEETTAQDAPEVKPVVVELKKETVSQKQSKASKKTKKVRSRRYQEVISQVERTKNYPLNQAVELAQKLSYTKFPGTLEAHIDTAMPNIRGLVAMPYVSGKALKVLAFGPSVDSGLTKELEELGAIVGTGESIEDINKGKIDFDVIVATPEWMPKLAKIARILGPRGLMPNPKSGTVGEDLKKIVADVKGGKVEYKTEAKGQVIHIAVGKTDQNIEEVSANVKALYNTIGRSRIKKITLSPTMGPGIKVEISSI